jgi:alpha-1,6-mannosyltransferase
MFVTLKHVANTLWHVYKDQYLMLGFLALFIVQFHLPFYASRPLPNVYALCFQNMAISFYLRGRFQMMVSCLAFATIVLRCDTIVFALPMILYPMVNGWLWHKKGQFVQFIKYGVGVSLLSILFTVGVDSMFWNRLVWPELEMLWFNTYENRSHEWGVSAWHWYFTSAIPKSCTLAIPLILIAFFYNPMDPILGFIDRNAVKFMTPPLIFVAMFSFLPHKELRFIFPALVMFNCTAAIGIAKILRDLHDSMAVNLILKVILVGLFAGSSAFALLMTEVSHRNYPGGTAMRNFN